MRPQNFIGGASETRVKGPRRDRYGGLGAWPSTSKKRAKSPAPKGFF